MTKLFYCLLTVFVICNLPGRLSAQNAPYAPDKEIALSGDGSFDFLQVDELSRRLYVSHGTAVHIIDLDTEKEIGMVADMIGVHGIAVAGEFNTGFISDGKANAVVAFDLKTFKKLVTIALQGKKPDAIIYDPFSKKVFAFNNESNNASVIDPKLLKQTTSVKLSGAPEFAVADGNGKMYANLEDKNSVSVIDTRMMKVTRNYPLSPCGKPTGIAFDHKNGLLFSVCRDNKGLTVADSKTGKVITTMPIGAGVDAVVFDAEKQLIIASNADGTASVFKQNDPKSYALVQTLKTANRAKTMALDPKTHKIYFSSNEIDKVTLKVLPGTFKLLVYHLQ